MPLKNYTTSVSAERTVVEIMGILAAKGLRRFSRNMTTPIASRG